MLIYIIRYTLFKAVLLSMHVYYLTDARGQAKELDCGAQFTQRTLAVVSRSVYVYLVTRLEVRFPILDWWRADDLVPLNGLTRESSVYAVYKVDFLINIC